MMRTSLVAAVLFATVAFASACNDAGLSGDTGRQIHASSPNPAVPSASTPSTTTKPGTTGPGASTTTVPGSSQPTTPTDPTTPTTPIIPGIDTGSNVGSGSGPGIGTETGTGTGDHPGLGSSIFDIIGGLIKQLTDVKIDQPNANEVIFGGDKTFHIGDGDFAASSECSAEIHTYNLKGTRYFFEFEVLADDTTVDVDIGKIFGVDYNESNSIFLQTDASTNLDQKPLSKAQASAAFTTQKLNKGKYTILVESRATGAENPGQPNDHDDYIVGKVHVKGDKPIKPGKVGARP